MDHYPSSTLSFYTLLRKEAVVEGYGCGKLADDVEGRVLRDLGK